MKKTKQYISLLLAAFMAAGLSSCIKEDYAGASDETATVNLVFDTRADNDGDGLDDDALPGEGIKTLRVIIVDTDNNRVDVNELRDFSGETPQPVLQKTLTIMGLPVGNKDFYVIANEASVGLSGLDTPGPGDSFNEAEKSALLSTLINDEQHTYFPSTDTEIEENGLPIAGTVSAEITGAEDQTIEIPITRAVAKMELTLTNATGGDFELNQVVLGSFFANSTYLFPQETALTLPGEVAYEGHTFQTNETLSDGASQTFHFYFYESKAGGRAYTIALNDGGDYVATPIMLDEDMPLTSVARNTCLRVTGTIESKDVEVSPIFRVVVVNWDTVENPEISFD